MADERTQTIKYFILLLVIVVPLFSLGLSNHGLWSADEPRVAEIGREMALTGNWAVPTLNQRPFLEEPPLYYGALALTFKIFGISDKTARIPSAFFAFATVLVVFFAANFLFGPRVALFSSIILATGGEYFRVAHWVLVDNALTFFIVCAMALFVSGYFSTNSRKKFFSYILMYVACILAFYTKGFIGIVLPGLGILVFLIFEKNLKEIIKMRLWLGILIFLAMTLPWFIALWQQAGTEYLKVFLLHNHLQRFLPANFGGQAVSGHHQPFYYYITEFPVGFLPWSILLIPVIIHAFSKHGTPDDPSSFLLEKGTLFAKCWFFAGIIFLSIASTKRTLYLMPVFAPAAILTAVFIDSTLVTQSTSKTGKIFTLIFGIVVIIVGLALAPMYFYFKKLYPLDVPENLLLSVLFFSIVIVAFSLMAIKYFQRADFKRYWVTSSISVIMTLLFMLIFAAPIVDRHKSFAPFCRQVSALVPAGESIYTYEPDETIKGVIPFYTGRYVTEINEVTDELFRKETPCFIVIRDKEKEIEKKLLSANSFPL